MTHWGIPSSARLRPPTRRLMLAWPRSGLTVESLVLATFNIHLGVDGWGRPFDIIGQCAELGADVLVMQESWGPDGGGRSTAEGVADELGYTVVAEQPLAHVRALRARPEADDRWGPASLAALPLLSARPANGGHVRRSTSRPVPGRWSLAVLARVPVRDQKIVSLGHLRHDPADRAVIFVTTDLGSRAITIVGTHMAHLTDWSPLQYRRLAALLPPADTPAALAGDMNLWGPPVTLLLPGLAAGGDRPHVAGLPAPQPARPHAHHRVAVGGRGPHRRSFGVGPPPRGRAPGPGLTPRSVLPPPAFVRKPDDLRVRHFLRSTPPCDLDCAQGRRHHLLHRPRLPATVPPATRHLTPATGTVSGMPEPLDELRADVIHRRRRHPHRLPHGIGPGRGGDERDPWHHPRGGRLRTKGGRRRPVRRDAPPVRGGRPAGHRGLCTGLDRPGLCGPRVHGAGRRPHQPDHLVAAGPGPTRARALWRPRGGSGGHVLHRRVRPRHDGRRHRGRPGAEPAVPALRHRPEAQSGTSACPTPTPARWRSGRLPARACSACASQAT